MRRSQAFWLLAWLSASCAVRGFTIQDELPGGDGGSASNAGNAGAQSGSGASQNQGGDGVAGTTPQGGKAGGGGSQGDAGTPAVDGGEPSVGVGGEGAGGAPSTTTEPCDQSDGQPPLLCDDFESGNVSSDKWTPPAGVPIVVGDEGPHGPTKLAHLNSQALESKLGDLPITAVGDHVTVSFWLKQPVEQLGQPLITFRDRSAAATTLRLSGVAKELGWRHATSNFYVPQTPTSNQFAQNTWTCVSITLRFDSIELRYQAKGSASIATLVADSEPTAGVDANWQNLPADNRFAHGYPAFGGIFNGVATDIFIDDVRVARGASNVCGF